MTRARDLASGLNGIRPFATASGTVSIGSGNSATVTFPAGRFTQTPVIQVTPNQSALAYMTIASFGGVSTTGMTVYMQKAYADATSGGSVNWVAVQMTSGSANG